MDHQLTIEDLDFILASLEYTKKNFRESKDHPDYKFKQSQLKKVEDLANKIKVIKKNQ